LCKNSHDAFQVVLVDINEKNGQQLLQQFMGEYGKDSAIFLKCDVSKQDELKGLY